MTYNVFYCNFSVVPVEPMAQSYYTSPLFDVGVKVSVAGITNTNL